MELTTRLAVLLLRLHHVQLVGTAAARPVLASLRTLLHKQISETRDLVGKNIAGLQHLQRAHAAAKSTFGEDDAPKLPVKRRLED